MPDFKLNTQQETELNGFVSDMESDNLSDEEISSVVDNYISEKAGESYEEPETLTGISTEEEPEFGPVEGTEEEVVQSDADYKESIEADPLEEVYRRHVALNPEEEASAVASAVAQKQELYSSFNGEKGENIYRILGDEDTYNDYLAFLRTGEVVPNELDIANSRQGVSNIKERNFLSSLGYKDSKKFEEIAANSKERLKSSSKELSKYAPLVNSKVAIIEPLQKQAEELRISIDNKLHTGEDSSKDVEARKGLLEKISKETEGFSDLFSQYTKANRNTMNDSQIADAFSRTYSPVKRLEQSVGEAETDISILISSLLTGENEPPSKMKEALLAFKESKLKEREFEEAFRAQNLPKPIAIEDIDGIGTFGSYAADALINNAPSILISAAGSLTGMPYLAYPLFFGIGAGAKLSSHELVKRGGNEEIKRIERLLESATDKDTIASLSKEKRNIENTLTVPEWKKWLTVGSYGAAELVFEKYGTMKIFDNIRDASKLAGKADLKKGFKAFSSQYANKAVQTTLPFIEGFTTEALTEGATTLTQNWLDINVIGEEKALDEGLSDSLLQGGLIGGMIQSGGSVSSSLINAASDQALKDKITVSNVKVNAILEQIYANEDATPKERADLIGDLLKEVRSTSNLEGDIIAKLNQLTPTEQRDLIYSQRRIDILNAQRIGVEESSVSDEVKEQQLDIIEAEAKELVATKEGIINKTLNSSEVQQLEDLDTSIEGVEIDPLRTKISGNVEALELELARMDKSLKANQAGPEKTATTRAPLLKLIAKGKKNIEKIDKFLDEKLEKAIERTVGAANEAGKEEALREERKKEKDRKEKLKHTVKTDDAGRITEVSDEQGNFASPATAQKRVLEHIPEMDLVGGKTIGQKGIFPQHENQVGDEIASESENAYEIARQIEIESGKTEKEESAKGYKEAAIAENVRLTEKDYDHYGDVNTREGISKAWFDKDGTPLDTQAKSLSEEFGIEITPQDIIDTINDNPSNPNRYVHKTRSIVTDLRLRFHEVTGINPTPTVLKKVLQEGSKQTEQGFAPDETTTQALQREAAERKSEYETALQEIHSQELAQEEPTTTEEKVDKPKITLKSPTEVKGAKKDLKASVLKDVNSDKYDIEVGRDNFTASDKVAAYRIAGGAVKRGLSATITPKGNKFVVEIIDPSSPKPQSKFSDLISHLDEIYDNMPKGSTLYSTVVPIPSGRAFLGLLIDALKAVRSIIRAGKSIADAISETHDLIKDHMTEKQWGDFINKNIAPKEVKRQKLEQDKHAFYYTDEIQAEVTKDIQRMKDEKDSFPAVPVIADPKSDESAIQQKADDLVENTPTDTYDSVYQLFEDQRSSISFQENLDHFDAVSTARALSMFAGTLLGTNLYEDPNTEVEDSTEEDVYGDEEADVEKENTNSIADFHTRFGRQVDPNPIGKDGKPMDPENINLYYGKIAHAYVDKFIQLGLLDYVNNFSTGGQWHVKVLDAGRLNDFITHAMDGHSLSPEDFGLVPAHKDNTYKTFRSGGYDMVSNVQPEVKEWIETPTKDNKEVRDAINNASETHKLIGRDVLGIVLHPSYQATEHFTFEELKDLVDPEVIKFWVKQNELAFNIAIAQGTDPYKIKHSYGYRYRMYARSLGVNYQSNKHIRSIETLRNKENLPLTEKGMFFLQAQITDAFGEKFTSYLDRYNFAANNRTSGLNFMQIVKDPFSPESVELFKRAKEPVKFLASVLELGKALNHEGGPENYPSNLKLSFDYTSSVNQHMALKARTERMARVANLGQTDTKFDPYIETAIEAIEGIVPPKLKGRKKFIKAVMKELANYNKIKSKATEERRKAKDAYIKRAAHFDDAELEKVKEENKTLSAIKKKMRAADKAHRESRGPGLLKPATGAELASILLEEKSYPARVAKVIQRIISAEAAWKSASNELSNFKGRVGPMEGMRLEFESFFSRPDRVKDMRSPSKISNMRGNYGASVKTIAQDMYDQLSVATNNKGEPLYEGITLDHTKFLADRFEAAEKNQTPELKLLLDFYKLGGKQAAELGIPIKWYSAITGGLVVQYPRYPSSKGVGMVYRGQNDDTLSKVNSSGRINPYFFTKFKDTLNKRSMQTALAANHTHSGDSGGPGKIFSENKYPADFTHDEGSTIGYYAGDMKYDLNEALVETYEGKDWLLELLDLNPQLTEAREFYEDNLAPGTQLDLGEGRHVIIGEADVRDVMFNPHTAGAGGGFNRVSEGLAQDKTTEELALDLLNTLGIDARSKLDQTGKLFVELEGTPEEISGEVSKNAKQIDLFGEFYKSDQNC